MKSKKGILIAFEGPEGSGKSTQAELFYKRLLERKIPAILTKEPNGKIREILLSENLDVFTELFLFLANRNEHFIKLILPALKEGKIAVTDRCSASTIAYQVFGGQIPAGMRDFIMQADAIARKNYEIDINILIDCSVEVGLERAERSRDKLTSFEKKEMAFHNRVRQGYLRQAKDDPEHWKIFDGTKSIEGLREEIWNFLNNRFNLKE